MSESELRSYYLTRREDILDVYETHSRAWRPFLARRCGEDFAEEVIEEAREMLEGVIPELPYIGGDDNPMTYHIIRCTTSLALYKAMKARGKPAEETGKIIYDAVAEATEREPADVILIEGAYSAGPALADLVDLSILVDVPVEQRHARLRGRDDRDFLETWHRRWDPAERTYFRDVRPKSSFDLVVRLDQGRSYQGQRPWQP